MKFQFFDLGTLKYSSRYSFCVRIVKFYFICWRKKWASQNAIGLQEFLYSVKSYTLFSCDNFRKSFETAKFYSQIPYSFIKLITFEVNPLNKGPYLKLFLIYPNNFDTATNLERFPTTEFLNFIILTLRSKVMVD
jgi:hypothetical protein